MRRHIIHVAAALCWSGCGDNLAPDTTAPIVEITGGPDSAIASTTPTFTFTVSDDAAAVECAVDTEAATPCTSPVTTAPLDQGAHTFTVSALDKAGNFARADRSFSVDTIQPVVMITAGPTGLTNNPNPVWTFVTTDNPTVVECSVDGGAMAACAHTFTAPHLDDGDHMFTVHVADTAGNSGNDERAISLDTVAPVVAITGGPSATTFDTTPTFTFTITGSFATSRCRIDGAAFVACTDTYTPSSLGGGAHAFEVQALDAAGNIGTATQAFTVDASAPTISITSSPGAVTNNPTPAFTFVAGATATIVQCQIDGGPFADCTSPFITPPLSEGSHAFEVQACTATPACANDARTFTVDLTPPEVAITSGPADPHPTNAAQPMFGFTVTGAATIGCRITSTAAADPAYATCATTFTSSATLADGGYAFEILATDDAGNAMHATQAFTVDRTGPVIAAVAPLIAARTSLQMPFVFFTVTDASTAAASCSVDGGSSAPCDGTLGFRAPAVLPEGMHSYTIGALDEATNFSTIQVPFVVDITPPTVTITGGTTDPTTDLTPAFTFTTSADTTRVRCALDSGEVLDPCTSGEEFPAIVAGSHTVTITAYDDATPANTATATKAFVLSICGDGVIQGGEQCEGSNLNGGSCTSVGHDSGTLACDPATCKFVETGCGDCGNGVIDGSEQCDGALLAGATCESLGATTGALACSSSCELDQSECFSPAGGGFTGPVCYGGVKYNNPGTGNVMACSQTAGLFRDLTAAPTTPLWTAVNGTGSTSINNLNGRAIFSTTSNGAIGFIADDTVGHNAFRSNDATSSGATWQANAQGSYGSVNQATMFELYGARIGTGAHGTMYAGWSPLTGFATLVHGSNTPATIAASTLGPNADGSSPTGIARSIAGQFDDSVAATDVYIAVFGQHPDGTAATGGIYWTCNTNNNSTVAAYAVNAGVTIERDTGISAADRALIWSLTADPSSKTSSPARTCAGTASVSGVGSVTLLSSVATGTTATFTTSADHGFATGASVVVAGVTGGGCITGTSSSSCVSPYNGTWTIASVPSSSTFTATLTMAPTGPSVDLPVGSYNTTYYAAMRGGNSVYKTTNAGASWAIASTGIPDGTEVYDIAIDCWRPTTAIDLPNTTCVNPQSLWAGTSDGLYHSINGGTSWARVAFEGTGVRSVTLNLVRAATNTPAPKLYLGVEDGVAIYSSN